MKQIDSFNIARLHLQEDFNFQTRVRNLAIELLTQETDKAMVDAYKASIETFDAALKQSDKNSYTAALAEADAKADKRWSAAYAYVKAMTGHPHGEEAEAATGVLDIFQKYGILTSMGYDEEYGRYANLLQDLFALPEETRMILHLDTWIDSMDTAVLRFRNLREEKTKEESAYVVGLAKDARTAADAAYKSLVQRVNALVIVMGEEPYATFIDRLNVMISEAQALLSSRSTKSAKAKKDEETPSEDTPAETPDTPAEA